MTSLDSSATVIPDAAAGGSAPSDLGSSTLATAIPLLMSPALAKFASGVEAVMKSQSNLAKELERLNAEILRLDSVPSTPAQVEAAEKLKRCRKLIESVSKYSKNIKTRIGTINGYKATILQHMPELKPAVISGAESSGNVKSSQVISDAADAIIDTSADDADIQASEMAGLSSNSTLDPPKAEHTEASPSVAADAVVAPSSSVAPE